MSRGVSFDAITKITTIVEIPDEPITEPTPQPPTLEEVVSGLIEQLVGKGVIS